MTIVFSLSPPLPQACRSVVGGSYWCSEGPRSKSQQVPDISDSSNNLTLQFELKYSPHKNKMYLLHKIHAKTELAKTAQTRQPRFTILTNNTMHFYNPKSFPYTHALHSVAQVNVKPCSVCGSVVQLSMNFAVYILFRLLLNSPIFSTLHFILFYT